MIIRKFLPLFVSLFFSLTGQAQRFVRVDSFRAGAYGAAAWGDYDGDGRPDLAYGAQTMQTGQPDFLTIYHNTPGGLVALPINLPYMAQPQLCWADLDNNGADELIVSGLGAGGTATTVYQYNSSGSLTPITGVHLPGYENGYTAAADYNGDGWKDLAMTGYDSSSQLHTTILKGGPGLSFTPLQTSLIGAQAGEIKWGDFNGDGRPDLLLNGYTSGIIDSRIWIYQNMGNDSFQLLATHFPGTAGTVDWLDYDGDGKLDFLVTGVDTTGTHNRTDLYHNNGNGSFTAAPTNIPQFGEPSAVAVGDFNRDGKPDLGLAGGNDSTINYVLLAYGTGTAHFILDTLYPADIVNCIAETADFDGDGFLDMLLSGNLLKNRGSVASVSKVPATGFKLCIYPNPVLEAPLKLTWQATSSGQQYLTLLNATGVVLRREEVSQQAGENYREISTKDLVAGMYFIQIGTSEAIRFLKP